MFHVRAAEDVSRIAVYVQIRVKHQSSFMSWFSTHCTQVGHTTNQQLNFLVPATVQ